MLDQGTETWHQDRCGYISASRLTDVLKVTPGKWKVLRDSGSTLKVCADEQQALEVMEAANIKKPGHSLSYDAPTMLKGFTDYAADLVCERMTGVPQINTGGFGAMQWGKDNEGPMVTAYEARTGRIVTSCGFIKASPETGLLMYGASPDGLVGMEGSIEGKCPQNSVNHLRCFVEGIPEEHWPQLEGQLIATGRDWVDFVSFDGRFVGEWEHLQVFIKRYTSKPELREEIMAGIALMEAYISQFIQSLPKAA